MRQGLSHPGPRPASAAYQAAATSHETIPREGKRKVEPFVAVRLGRQIGYALVQKTSTLALGSRLSATADLRLAEILINVQTGTTQPATANRTCHQSRPAPLLDCRR